VCTTAPGGEEAIAIVCAAADAAKKPEEPSPEDAIAWLDHNGLLTGAEDRAAALRRFKALSRCKFGEGVP
jgi:hypothetical protein